MNMMRFSKMLVSSALTALPIMLMGSAEGQSGVYNGLYWINTGDAIDIYGHVNGLSGAVAIPPTITNLQVTSIGYEAFYNCYNLTSITIPNSVSSIGETAFADCNSLTNIMIPNSITSIGEYAFYNCSSLTNFTIPGSVTNIGQIAFYGCTNLTDVTFPNSVASLGFEMFADCYNLTGITISRGVASLGQYAFLNDYSLTNITIPNSVTNIGDYAFQGCSSLTSIYFQGNAPTADPTVFVYDNSVTVYYLPGTTGWSNFSANTFLMPIMWNPLIQTNDVSFSIQNNHFGFNITNGSTTNIPIVVESCTNLANPVWTPLTNVMLTNGSFYFSDPNWTNYPTRFYGLGFP